MDNVEGLRWLEKVVWHGPNGMGKEDDGLGGIWVHELRNDQLI